jgi:hypothetical protein
MLVPDELWKLLIQLPIVAVVVWVVLRLLHQATAERAVFMTAMSEQSRLFTAELKAERESREATMRQTMASLTELSTAITELRSEVRLSHATQQRVGTSPK